MERRHGHFYTANSFKSSPGNTDALHPIIWALDCPTNLSILKVPQKITHNDLKP
jgi:hypothetical protein